MVTGRQGAVLRPRASCDIPAAHRSVTRVRTIIGSYMWRSVAQLHPASVGLPPSPGWSAGTGSGLPLRRWMILTGLREAPPETGNPAGWGPAGRVQLPAPALGVGGWAGDTA